MVTNGRVEDGGFLDNKDTRLWSSVSGGMVSEMPIRRTLLVSQLLR